MAVVGRAHEGDGGNNDDPWGWQPPSGCKGSGSRAPRRPSTRGPTLATIASNNNQRLPVLLDSRNRTWKSYGQYATAFTRFVGLLARRVPYYYESWEQVPSYYLESIIADIRELFRPRSILQYARG